MSRTLAFLSHPVAGDVSGNVARALRWMRYLAPKHPDRVILAPWAAGVMAFDDSNPAERARGMDDNFTILRRCDSIILVGGRISGGMRAELEVAKSCGLEVLSLVELGEEPPL